MKKQMFVYFLFLTVCLFHLLVPDVVFGQAIQVFNKYESTFKHPDVHAHFPDVLNAFKSPENQVFRNPALIGRFADKPRSIRNLYEKTDNSILIHLLLDSQFQALFKDPDFHNMLQSSNQINALVRLIQQTTPHSPDPTGPTPPQPEPPRATTLNIVSGNNQSGDVDEPLAQRFVVGVLDQEGKPLQGTAVTFRVTAGNGRLSPTRQTTDVYGQARTTLTLGSRRGSSFCESKCFWYCTDADVYRNRYCPTTSSRARASRACPAFNIGATLTPDVLDRGQYHLLSSYRWHKNNLLGTTGWHFNGWACC